MMAKPLEDVGAGIDCEYVRQPLGVFAAVTPFNFPAMVPCWFWPYAIATGNTFILKPSEQVPFSPTLIVELAHEAGIPAGVLNVVHGAKDAVNALLAHAGITGISFVGSSPVAKHVYLEAAKHGKRVQALGGAKNHVIVMPDADMDRAVANISESLFGCAGQRCLAGSVVVAAGKAYEPFRERLLATAKSLRLGYGLEPDVNMGPVVSARHKERVLSYVEAGRKDGAVLLLDGRSTKVEKHPRGHFVGPTVFDGVQPDMTIGKEEIFGPVASVTHVSNLDEGIEMVRASGLANATSIFTQSGKAAREFRYRVGVSMIGVKEVLTGPYFCPSKDAKWCDIAEPIPGPTIERMQKLAKKHEMVMIVPIYEREMAGVYYNTAAVIDADGSYLGKYRKNHIPHTAGFWEKFFFKPGNLGYPVFKTRYATIGVSICYERHFREGARLLGLHGSEIVFNP